MLSAADESKQTSDNFNAEYLKRSGLVDNNQVYSISEFEFMNVKQYIIRS